MVHLGPQPGQLPDRLTPTANTQLNLHHWKVRGEMTCLKISFAKPQTTYPSQPACPHSPHSDRWLGDLSTVHVRAKNKEPRQPVISGLLITA